MDEEPPRRPFDILPVILLILAVLVGLGGWWMYPWLQRQVFLQDCTASGRTNC